MDNSSYILRDLAKYLINLTEPKRKPVRLQSNCQYTYCRFSNSSDPDATAYDDCTVIPDLISELADYTVFISKYIHLCIFPIIILLGIFGNILSFSIMLANTRRSGYPVSFYLPLLALVDCLYLITHPLPGWIATINTDWDIRFLSNLTCRLTYFLGNFITHVSAGLVVGITVERFIAVQYPLLAHKMNNAIYTRVVLMILVLVLFVLDCSIMKFIAKSEDSVHEIHTCNDDTTSFGYYIQNRTRCDVIQTKYLKIWSYYDLIIYNMGPFIIITVLNGLIIRRLINAHQGRQVMFLFNGKASNKIQQEIKHRSHSVNQSTAEPLKKNNGKKKHFRSLSETKSLVVTFQTQSDSSEDRCFRHNSVKISSTSTEISTLSSESNRSRRQYRITPTNRKVKNPAIANNRRLTILLLFVSCSFLILTLPSVAVNIYMVMKSESNISTKNAKDIYSIAMENLSEDHDPLYTLARLLMITNHSINFILYFVFGKRFRRDFKKLFENSWKRLYG